MRPASLAVLPAAVGRSPVLATAVYEFRMAVRGRVLWVCMLPLLALAALLVLTSPRAADLSSASAKVGVWAVLINMLTTVGIGVALTDRVSRVQRLGLADLLAAMPVTGSQRLAGTIAGALAAALAPAAAVMLTVGIVLGAVEGAPGAPLWALLAFVTIILPGAAVLSTFATALGTVVPLATARVVVVLVWLWMTLFSTRVVPLPTVTGTVLSPLGDYVAVGWLHAEKIWAGMGSPALLSPRATGATAAVSLTVLVAMTCLLFTVTRLLAGRRV